MEVAEVAAAGGAAPADPEPSPPRQEGGSGRPTRRRSQPVAFTPTFQRDAQPLSASPASEEGVDEEEEEEEERLTLDTADEVQREGRVGALVWAVQKGFPWWPAMLTYNPNAANFVRRRTVRGRANAGPLEYHLQFFGSTYTRAWIARKNLMLWQGPGGKDGVVFPAATDKKPNGRLERSFQLAVAQAMDAFPLRTYERLHEYIGEYRRAARSSEAPAGGSGAGKGRAPKKPLTAYVHFLKEYQNVLAVEQPQMDKSERFSAVAAKWAQLSPAERQPYEEINRQDKERYQLELSAYTPPAGAHEGGAARPARIKDPNAPRKPLSSFLHFCREKRPPLVADFPELSVTAVGKLLGKRWQELTDVEKVPYEAQASVDRGRYDREMLTYVPPQRAAEAAADESAPVKPADPLSAAQLFALDERTRMESSGESAGLTEQQVAAAVGGRWADLEEEQRAECHAAAAEEAERHRVALEAYRAAIKAHRKSERDTLPPGEKKAKQPENICAICCEGPSAGPVVHCEGGTCQSCFHLGCIGLASVPTNAFTCDLCTTGNLRCFVCDEPAGDEARGLALRGCDEPGCTKLYHVKCATELPRSKFDATEVVGEKFICPLHTCANCNEGPSAGHPMVRCVRCPVVYHEACLAAGVHCKDAARMVCTKHQGHKVTQSKNWSSICMICGEGGILLCCDTCPGAYHTECITGHAGFLGSVEAGKEWSCQDCAGGTKPMPGDVVWVKYGGHRWWPCTICCDDEIPERLVREFEDIALGDICVRFLGTTDFAWTNNSRCVPWVDGDDKGRFAAGPGKKPDFLRSLSEASARFIARCSQRGRDIDQIRSGVKLAPAAFQRIRANAYVCPRAPKLEVPECECSPADPCGEGCLNRMLYIECNPTTCPAGKLCQNRRLAKREYSKVRNFKTDNARGWGLEACELIPAGGFIIEYVGEVITTEQCRERLQEQDKTGSDSFYMMGLGPDLVIDARLKANLGRFANHSCEPNCVTQVWNVAGELRVGLFALEDIPSGTEITFNYQLDCLGNAKKVCHCGAPSCTGFIGGKKRDSPPPAGKGSKKRKGSAAGGDGGKKRKGGGRKRKGSAEAEQ